MNKTLYHISVSVGAVLTLVGCSAFEVVRPAQQTDEYVLACDKVEGRPGCKTRANEICPDGYDTLSSEEDFERKELRVRCSGGANPP